MSIISPMEVVPFQLKKSTFNVKKIVVFSHDLLVASYSTSNIIAFLNRK